MTRKSDMDLNTRQSVDIAGLKADIRNIRHTLDEMKADAKEREKMLHGILEQTQRTNGRVTRLEEHRDSVCLRSTAAIEEIKKRMWAFAGLMVGSGTVGGVAGVELIRRLFGL